MYGELYGGYMSNLIDDYIKTHQTTANLQVNSNVQHQKVEYKPNNTGVLRDEFTKEHKKNGLFEKFYNFLKNKTNFGFGSNKVEQSISEYEKGNKTEEDVRNDISKYRSSQKNCEQIFGDTLSATAAVGTYLGVSNSLNKAKTLMEINGGELPKVGLISDAISQFKKVDINKTVSNLLTKNKIIAFGAIAATLVGGLVKKYALKFNRVGSDEFKADKKSTTKQERKDIKKARRKENRKNFLTGALGGLLSPLVNVAGFIVGIPAYLATNFATRYLTQNKENKSLKDFGESLKDNAAMNIVGGTVLAASLIKKGKFSEVLNKNLDIVQTKLKGVNLVSSDLNTKTAYSQLEDIMVNSDTIRAIRFGDDDLATQIQKLSEENIFAVKFMQISDDYGAISKELRESCPTTRTLEEAEKFIAGTFGSKYKVNKQIGVGTIAETYLVKDTETGKEVCIKILKKGISAEKIDADKAKFVELVKSQVTNSKEQEYLLKNIEDLAAGIRQEVDFVNEMEAAKELVKYTKEARVVKPIEVKNNIYVMEKAEGISLKTLQEMVDLQATKRLAEKTGKSTFDLDFINEKIEHLKAKSPDFDFYELTEEQSQKLIKEYMQLQIEQFDSIYKNGKILHADIHPGNVFIDLEALKAGKSKVLTLIDTGNTVKMSKDQSEGALKLTQYVMNGNVKDITKYVLEGATLPNNLTKEQATELMEKELNKLFFDNETKLDVMTRDSVLKLTSSIMRKYDILPSSTQLNFEKAKTSSDKSFKSFIKSWLENMVSNSINDGSTKDVFNLMKNTTVGGTKMYAKYKEAQLIQDFKNLTQIGVVDALKPNKNMLKTNSEEYLTYKFKQQLDSNGFEGMSNMFG